MTTTHNPKPETVDTVTSTAASVAGSNVKAAESASKKQRKAASAFRTISEVADDLDVQQHVLRFWETKFSQVKPLKRGGGRRYYRPEDVALLKKIHNLLYTEGYTIKGVQKLLKGQGKQQAVADMDLPAQAVKPAANQAGTPATSQPAQQPQQPQATAQRQPAMQMPPIEPKTGLNEKQRSILKAMLGDLKELRDTLTTEGTGKA